jgi:two-component sensor histidine kinase
MVDASRQFGDRSPNRRSAAAAPKIQTAIVTNTLRFRCPNSGRVVDSGISTRYSTRLVSIRGRCPICGNLHEWLVVGESAGVVSSADHHAGDGRLVVEAQSARQDSNEPSAEIIKLREQLLDELNHRLKNNLQILMGLLQIAWRKTDNKEARDVLLDTRRRVGAMRTAQQVFYSVHNSTDVSGQNFLEAVCGNAKAFFAKEVSINRETATGSLPKETAVPLALVLNELLTNAAKHGANERGRVTINVGLSQRSGEIEVYVQDRGSGFNLKEVQGRSSGLCLVTKLTRRLHGTFTVERRSGARCTLRIPDQ